MIQARLFKDREDHTHSVCVDTGSTATFIDVELLPRYAIVHNIHPITIKGVSGQQIVDRYVDLPLHISESEGQRTLHTKAYTANGIHAGVLLGMDELGKDEHDIVLWLGRKMMQIDDSGINVPISFISLGCRPTTFHAYTVQSDDSAYPLIKLKKSHGENVGYPHTKLYQSPTHDTPFRSADFVTHKSPPCPQRFPRKLHAESPAFPACHMHSSTSPDSHELPSYHGISSSSPTCRRCNASFHSNNALHHHLRVYRHRQRG